MWIYEKKLEYPVKIKNCNPKLAKVIITQYGGPDGEIGASLRYLSQRFSMVTPQARAVLNDIGTEELAHMEIVGSIVRQLMQNASIEQIKAAGAEGYYADHDKAVYPLGASGMAFTADALQSKGDPVTDLTEDMAAEQKARSTYEWLINLCDDPDVIDPLKFLREREVVHFQRFGEALEIVSDFLECKKLYPVMLPYDQPR
jgi:spore coat protein JC